MLTAWETAFHISMEAYGRNCCLGGSLTVLSARRVELVIVNFTDFRNVGVGVSHGSYIGTVRRSGTEQHTAYNRTERNVL